MKNLRRILGSAVRLALVPGIRGENGYARSYWAPGLIDDFRNEICFVRVMECSNRELELVRETNKSGEVHGFIDMNVHLKRTDENHLKK